MRWSALCLSGNLFQIISSEIDLGLFITYFDILLIQFAFKGWDGHHVFGNFVSFAFDLQFDAWNAFCATFLVLIEFVSQNIEILVQVTLNISHDCHHSGNSGFLRVSLASGFFPYINDRVGLFSSLTGLNGCSNFCCDFLFLFFSKLSVVFFFDDWHFCRVSLRFFLTCFF